MAAKEEKKEKNSSTAYIISSIVVILTIFGIRLFDGSTAAINTVKLANIDNTLSGIKTTMGEIKTEFNKRCDNSDETIKTIRNKQIKHGEDIAVIKDKLKIKK